MNMYQHVPMKYCPQADSDLSSVGKVLYGSSPLNFISGIRISQLGIYYRIKYDITVCLNQRLVCFFSFMSSQWKPIFVRLLWLL